MFEAMILNYEAVFLKVPLAWQLEVLELDDKNVLSAPTTDTALKDIHLLNEKHASLLVKQTKKGRWEKDQVIEAMVQNIGHCPKGPKGHWINEDVYSAFAMKNKDGINSFARLNGLRWTILDSHDRLQGSIKHALTNIELKQRIVVEYMFIGDEIIEGSYEAEQFRDEVYAVLGAGGPTIDLENVSNKEKEILDSSGYKVKCKSIVIV